MAEVKNAITSVAVRDLVFMQRKRFSTAIVTNQAAGRSGVRLKARVKFESIASGERETSSPVNERAGQCLFTVKRPGEG